MPRTECCRRDAKTASGCKAAARDLSVAEPDPRVRGMATVPVPSIGWLVRGGDGAILQNGSHPPGTYGVTYTVVHDGLEEYQAHMCIDFALQEDQLRSPTYRIIIRNVKATVIATHFGEFAVRYGIPLLWKMTSIITAVMAMTTWCV